jgi:protein arginine kinase activator
MLCERCKKQPATFYVTRIVNGEKTETHLCQECAAETGHLNMVMEPQVNFTNFLAGLLNNEMGFAPPTLSATTQCSNCGLTYDDFRQQGQFACSHCYEDFDEYLDALLRRIQGSSEHTGKTPARSGGALKVQREVETLKRQLTEAVAKEEFEKAAQLRDRLRKLEKERTARDDSSPRGDR